MPSKTKTAPTAFFWKLADPLLRKPEISEGTLMGFPCLRVDGEFFATCDHRTGDLIVKLSRDRVKALIDEGVGAPFAPAGRVFREWVLVQGRDAKRWRALMDGAREFVATDG